MKTYSKIPPTYLYAAKVCPVCSGPITKIKDPCAAGPHFSCPEITKLPNGKEFNHYYFDVDIYHIKIYWLPYKIIIESRETQIYHLRRKVSATSPLQFNKILTVPTKKIPLDDGQALINKIKTWNLFR